MAKNKIEIDVKVDDKGTMKKVALDSKKAGDGLDKLATSSRTADRNLKGAAQASANGTKNFSKMAQGMGGLVGVYASVAASVFAVSAAFEFLRKASDFKVLTQAQDQYAASTGSMLKSITLELQAASGGMLQFQEAAQAAAIGAAKGFSSSQLVSLVEGARKTSAALGRSFQDSFDRLIRGVSKAEPELLDELGITLRLQTATEKYAKSIGVAVDELTAYQRSMAVLNEVQEQLDKNFGSINVDEIVNPFNQLAATFDSVVKTLTQGVLPVFESFANIINRSAVSAVAVFGSLFVSVAKAAIPVEDLKSGFQEMSAGIDKSLENSKNRLAALRQEVEATKVSLSQVQAGGSLGVQKSASGFVERGTKSKILKKASIDPGSLNKADKANLAKALKSAEAQYKKSGEIVTGIFKGEDIKRVRSFAASMNAMNTETVKFGVKAGNVFKTLGIRAQQAGALIRKSLVGAVGVAGKAVGGLGRGFNKVLGAAGFVGLIVFALEMGKELYYSFYSITSSILGFFDKMFNTDFGKGVASALSSIMSGVSSFIKVVSGSFASLISGITGLMADALAFLGADELSAKLESIGNKPKEFVQSVTAGLDAASAKLGKIGSGEAKSDFKGTFQESGLGKASKAISDNQERAQKATAAAESLAEAFGAVSTASKDIIEGLNDSERKLTQFDKKLIRARATTTSGLTGKLESLTEDLKYLSEEQIEDTFSTLTTSLQDLANVGDPKIKAIADAFGGAITTENLPLLILALKDAETSSSALLANTKAYEDTITSVNQKMGEYLSSDTGILQLENQLKVLDKQMKDVDSANVTQIELLEKFAAATGMTYEEAAKKVGALATEIRAVRDLNQSLTMEETQAANLTGLSKQAALEALEVRKADAAVRAKALEISILESGLSELSGDALVQQKNKIIELQNEYAILGEKAKNVEYATSDIGKMGMAVGETLQSSMQSAFQGIVEGTMTAKQAFASMATSILQSLAQVITKLLVIKMLEAAFGSAGNPIGKFLGIEGARTGGIFSNGKKMPGYAVGGVARGPNAGYPAILHGTEAVVPLPNGKSIPVDIKGSGQNNNVVVNVSVDSQGRSQTSTESQSSADAGNLGQAIARAVQQELQNQKRSGGILNPYGVS